MEIIVTLFKEKFMSLKIAYMGDAVDLQTGHIVQLAIYNHRGIPVDTQYTSGWLRIYSPRWGFRYYTRNRKNAPEYIRYLKGRTPFITQEVGKTSEEKEIFDKLFGQIVKALDEKLHRAIL